MGVLGPDRRYAAACCCFCAASAIVSGAKPWRLALGGWFRSFGACCRRGKDLPMRKMSSHVELSVEDSENCLGKILSPQILV